MRVPQKNAYLFFIEAYFVKKYGAVYCYSMIVDVRYFLWWKTRVHTFMVRTLVSHLFNFPEKN